MERSPRAGSRMPKATASMSRSTAGRSEYSFKVQGFKSSRFRMALFRFSWLIYLCLITVVAEVHSGQAVLENIKVGTSALSPTMAGVWMAKESGAFERHGINAELVYISSGAVVVQALVGGSLHAALGASNAVIAAILKGAPIIAVGSNTSRP